MPSLRPRMPLLAMTWVLRQCVIVSASREWLPRPGDRRSNSVVLHGSAPGKRSLRRRRLAKISGRASPPGPPHPYGESPEILAATRDSVEAGRSLRATCVSQRRQASLRYARALGSDLLDLDLDVDAGGEVEALEGLDGLRRGLDDVDQALVNAHLEVLARVLVDVRRPDQAVAANLGRERHGTVDLGLGAHHGLDDLLRRLVDDLVVVGLEPDPDLLTSCVRHASSRPSRLVDYSLIFVTRPAPTVRPPSRMAKRRPSSIAIGAMSSTCISTLSPGMTISTPSGRAIEPVMSVVRK